MERLQLTKTDGGPFSYVPTTFTQSRLVPAQKTTGFVTGEFYFEREKTTERTLLSNLQTPLGLRKKEERHLGIIFVAALNQ